MPNIEALSTAKISEQLTALRKTVCSVSSNENNSTCLFNGIKFFSFINSLFQIGYFSFSEAVSAADEYIDYELYHDAIGIADSQCRIFSKLSELPDVEGNVIKSSLEILITRAASSIGCCVKITDTVFMIYDKTSKKWNKVTAKKCSVPVVGDSVFIYHVNDYSPVSSEELHKIFDSILDHELFLHPHKFMSH